MEKQALAIRSAQAWSYPQVKAVVPAHETNWLSVMGHADNVQDIAVFQSKEELEQRLLTNPAQPPQERAYLRYPQLQHCSFCGKTAADTKQPLKKCTQGLEVL